MSDPASRPAGAPARPMLPVQMRARRYATWRTVIALMLREMSTRYGRTAGGFLWAILEPMAVIGILAIAFGLLLPSPGLGTSFILFYASGYLPFSLYQSVSLYVARSLVFSKPLLFYPSVTWVDAIIARFLLNTLTSLMVTYILLMGLLSFIDTRIVLQIGPIVESMALGALLGLGVGTLNCALMGLIKTWDMIWSILSRPLFLASGILFLYEDMPRFIQDILYYNPVLHIIAILRTGLYPMYDATFSSWLFVLGVSFITLTLGLLLLSRFHKDILNDD